MLNKKTILSLTCDGLHIYAHILGTYYPDRIVLVQMGSQCKTARNPFNGHTLSLNIGYEDPMFCHQDTNLANFKGDAFDFAALHYGLKDEELLQKINEDMNLDGTAYQINYKVLSDKEEEAKPVNTHQKFSFFPSPVTNTIPSAEMTVAEVYEVIKNGSYKNRTIQLRSMTDVNKARKYKSENFDYATFSGVFTNRSEKCLVEHSGLLTLDFDHVRFLPQIKNILLNDSCLEIVLMFTSPSGTGLKLIVAIDLTHYTHLEWFNAIATYLKTDYGLEVDKSGKDVSRACFLPWDPEAYINPRYL